MEAHMATGNNNNITQAVSQTETDLAVHLIWLESDSKQTEPTMSCRYVRTLQSLLQRANIAVIIISV